MDGDNAKGIRKKTALASHPSLELALYSGRENWFLFLLPNCNILFHLILGSFIHSGVKLKSFTSTADLWLPHWSNCFAFFQRYSMYR
jgi:hypothetical protein